MATPGTRDPSQFLSLRTASSTCRSASTPSGCTTRSSQAPMSASTRSETGNENIWTGTASDPVVTVTNTAASGGTAGTFQVHIPVGAVPAGGTDQTFSVDDTATHTWYSFGGFNWTGATTATVMPGVRRVGFRFGHPGGRIKLGRRRRHVARERPAGRLDRPHAPLRTSGGHAGVLQQDEYNRSGAVRVAATGRGRLRDQRRRHRRLYRNDPVRGDNRYPGQRC